MRRDSLILLTLLPCFGCEDSSMVVQPQPPPGATIRAIVPVTGRISDAVVIYGAHFDTLRRLYPVTFNGVPVSVEDHSDSIISVRVPLGASSGPIIVYTTRDSAVGPVFTVVPSCGQDLCVYPYDGPLLSEQQSWHRDCFYRFVRWSGQWTSDSVVLSQGYCVGDDSHYTLILRFKNYRGYPLPTIVDGSLIDREIEGTSTITLKGLVSIQSWDPKGVVSGKVSWFDERNRSWRDFVFWYEFSP